MVTPERITGKIYRIVVDKGFFFVRTADNKDWFIHRSELRGGWKFDALAEGMDVEFCPITDYPKGLRGTEAQVL